MHFYLKINKYPRFMLFYMKSTILGGNSSIVRDIGTLFVVVLVNTSGSGVL